MEITLIVVTLLSLAIAGAMSIVAWRVAGEERRRSEARVAALAADIRSSDADVDLPLETAVADAPTSGSMFTFIQPVTALPRLATVILAGVLVVGAGAALLVALGRSGDVAANSVTKPVARAAESQAAAPANDSSGARARRPGARTRPRPADRPRHRSKSVERFAGESAHGRRCCLRSRWRVSGDRTRPGAGAQSGARRREYISGDHSRRRRCRALSRELQKRRSGDSPCRH